MFAEASTLASPISYERRRPEQTLLYKVIQENLQTFLDQVHAKGDKLPDFVKDEFLAFLDCGVLAKGFLRLQCQGCHHEKLIALSCKKRGFCPSCGTKRMIETSALLMNHVIPKVAVRQWVLSFPFALRYLLVSDPKIMAKILKITTNCISSFLCKKSGFTKKQAKTAAVTLLQRFGGSANLNLHILFVDGVYTVNDTQTAAVFHRLPTPSAKDVGAVLNAISRKVLSYLKKSGHLTKDLEQVSLNLQNPNSGLDRIVGHSITYRIAYGPRAGQKVFTIKTQDPEEYSNSGGLTAADQGFSMHGGTSCEQHERKKLEFLCRYIARPALSEDRLSLAANGNVILKLKTPYSNGTTHINFSPLEFVEKLAALVPRPRIHLIRFHGLFAPHAKHRKLIVPNPEPEPKLQLAACGSDQAMPGEVDKPKVSKYRISWARLLKRVFDIDVNICQNCGAKVKIVAAIVSPYLIKKILKHLQLAYEPPKVATSRGPPMTQGDDLDDLDFNQQTNYED